MKYYIVAFLILVMSVLFVACTSAPVYEQVGPTPQITRPTQETETEESTSEESETESTTEEESETTETTTEVVEPSDTGSASVGIAAFAAISVAAAAAYVCTKKKA